ncbi:MAG TPA: GntR family transcriptional regulator [Bacillota bacterium]|nr:GntR family transcriptional regulator [Bacillota bacterium]
MIMDNSKPIYIQVSEWLENEILAGTFQVDDKVHSQYTLAEMFTINPATAAKGLNILADEDILYNKRGLGKFVSKNAKTIIKDKRKNQTLKKLLEDVVTEAERLDVTETELMIMLKQAKSKREGDTT